MKTIILAAAAVLSLGVGSAYAQGAPAGFADGTDYQGPGAGPLTAHRRSLTTPERGLGAVSRIQHGSREDVEIQLE